MRQYRGAVPAEGQRCRHIQRNRRAGEAKAQGRGHAPCDAARPRQGQAPMEAEGDDSQPAINQRRPGDPVRAILGGFVIARSVEGRAFRKVKRGLDLTVKCA